MNGRRVSLWQLLTEGGAFRGLLDLVCASRLAHVDPCRKQPGPICGKARANVDSSRRLNGGRKASFSVTVATTPEPFVVDHLVLVSALLASTTTFSGVVLG